MNSTNAPPPNITKVLNVVENILKEVTLLRQSIEPTVRSIVYEVVYEVIEESNKKLIDDINEILDTHFTAIDLRFDVIEHDMTYWKSEIVNLKKQTRTLLRAT